MIEAAILIEAVMRTSLHSRRGAVGGYGLQRVAVARFAAVGGAAAVVGELSLVVPLHPSCEVGFQHHASMKHHACTLGHWRHAPVAVPVVLLRLLDHSA